MVNVTPSAPQVYPILYTWNNNAYIISNLSGLGCADTVYSTQATTVNGTTTYAKYVVLPATSALNILDAYQTQFAVPSLACSSLLQQAASLTPPTNGNTGGIDVFGINVASIGGFIELMAFGLGIVLILGIFKRLIEWIGFTERRR